MSANPIEAESCQRGLPQPAVQSADANCPAPGLYLPVDTKLDFSAASCCGPVMPRVYGVVLGKHARCTVEQRLSLFSGARLVYTQPRNPSLRNSVRNRAET